ncbi:hypothetical protein HCQ94_02760 [Actinomyces sp. zg-332]|uniref:hypothetical protein n=1 Tax=Actinomyces sp. zg-332 TaxID=2708340 RepID=UPI001423FE90|nr:hypothetical protein [Actinomyces sp. zg-332]QPK94638.1 hypothetical protein HCQ94_02760 [Actinomyces sp. zg-332]
MKTHHVLVFSDDLYNREHIVSSLEGILNGCILELKECATADIAVEEVKNNNYDAIIMYGQTYKEGAMALAKRIQNELGSLPPTIMLVERAQDAWLSKWAGATKIVTLPVKPNVLRQVVADLLKGE